MPTMDGEEWEAGATARLALARQVAEEVGPLLMGHLATTPTVSHKGVVDLVTEADRRAEQQILESIRDRFPEDGILAEESGGALGTGTAWTWIVDPLDGTTNFVHGLDHFAVSIGVLHERAPALGVIGVPARGEVYWGGRGLGAWGPQGRLRVTDEKDLSEALVATGFPYDRRERAEALVAVLQIALQRARGVRRMGAAVLDLLGVAQGVFGAYWELGLSPWDVAAGLVLVEEAGGRISDFEGAPISDLREGRFIASNGVLHDAMVSLIRDGTVAGPG